MRVSIRRIPQGSSVVVLDAVCTIQCVECAIDYVDHPIPELRPIAVLRLVKGGTHCNTCDKPLGNPPTTLWMEGGDVP